GTSCPGGAACRSCLSSSRSALSILARPSGGMKSMPYSHRGTRRCPFGHPLAASPIRGSRRTYGMPSRLGRFVLPALVVVVCTLSVLIVLHGQASTGGTTSPKPAPALGSPTLVFVVNPPADPDAVAVLLAGPGAV